MSVRVHWFSTLVPRTRSKQAETEVPWHEGLTPRAILRAEGFSEVDMEAIMAVRGDTQTDLDAPLADGDRLEFLVSIQGGAEG
ncbi:MAG: hypothetical protein RMK15_10765 [Chloroflexota bacterium]|jgi:molybdopterin converting factor small subunit|nr:hypothetical protein [Dehalococcoidia bacterium]MDW8047746.1 hypothetical protein [Chloroflexota bacterium]